MLREQRDDTIFFQQVNGETRMYIFRDIFSLLSLRIFAFSFFLASVVCKLSMWFFFCFFLPKLLLLRRSTDLGQVREYSRSNFY